MRLGLEEANARVKLPRDRDVLVVRWKCADKGGVVGANLSDVGPLARTVGSVTITSCLGRYESRDEKEERYKDE